MNFIAIIESANEGVPKGFEVFAMGGFQHKKLFIGSTAVGLVPSFAVEALLESKLFSFFQDASSTQSLVMVDGGQKDMPNDRRTKLIADLLLRWKQEDRFECLRGWRDELYGVYDENGDLLVSIERSAVGLFGVRAFGCHLNGFTRVPDLRLWVSRRSFKKQTYPGLRDNMVGGGLPVGLSPKANIIKECGEEAGIPVEIASNASLVGTVAFWHFSKTRGLLPDTEFIYDLELPCDFKPKAMDGEVEEFTLMTLDQVAASTRNNEFTPEAALVNIDFLIRFGLLTPENEPDYLAISQGLRRSLPFHGLRRFEL